MSIQEQVSELAIKKGASIFGEEGIRNGVIAYFTLGFDASYTIQFSPSDIADHVFGYMTAKAGVFNGNRLSYASERDTDAFYFCSGSLECQQGTIERIEDFLASRQNLMKDRAMSIRSYHSQGTSETVVLFTVEFPKFIDATGKGQKLEELTTAKFLRTRPRDTKKRYQNILDKLKESIVPVYTINPLGNEMLALKMAFIPDRLSYLQAITTLLTTNIPDVQIRKKFVESFSNGAQVYTFYIRGATAEKLEAAATAIGMMPYAPERVTMQLYQEGKLDSNEVIYAQALTMFAYYFTPPHTTEDFIELSREIKHSNTNVTRLKKLRNEFFQQIMSEQFIGDGIRRHVGLVKALYRDFREGSTPESIAKLEVVMDQQLRNDATLEKSIFHTFLSFNQAVVKTNFLKVNRAAVAFRLDPTKFINKLDYPAVPHAIFMVLGSQFVGFHVRFTDIARGGVRMILSPNAAAYARNKRTLFAESYNLSYAQMLKNKDIPEGGSKGTILVSRRAVADRRTLFLQYVDSLIDMMVPTEGLIDKMKKEEILFLGPDENTAGAFPKIAAMHAKARGLKTWKSFTTGKSRDLGGIPHDMYGMTSRGVRQYVECIYEKLGLNPGSLTKFQTGGPDGDLGSNEILFANEKYVALVDGSGSIADPNGLNHEELLRLAKERKMLSHFDKSKLSSKGFFVSVKDKNVTLPDGNMIEDGELFRNTFHTSSYATADTFVPCGGRPASINIDTVHHFVMNVAGVTGQMMIENKVGNLAGTNKLRFKYIVEGANLFITHDARIALENVGVLLFKDSSANKGGVTCSSLEVFSGLALTDQEHREHMCVQSPEKVPEFYQKMVDEIIERIQANARREFEAIWKENKAGKFDGRNTLISDALSQKIVAIRRFVLESNLFTTEPKLVRYVVHKYTPKTMLERVSIEQIMERVPANYLRSIFSMWIASDFVYSYGLGANDFTFFQYMHDLTGKAAATSHL